MKRHKVNCINLAESYLNGNISFVRDKLLGNSAIALITAKVIKDNCGDDEYNRFIKLMVND